MISTGLARELREEGLVWTPASGDSFQIAPVSWPGEDFEGDVFTVSDMTIEAHSYSTGTVLGFNGTTEWALDSVALDDALWMPREDQLRDLLRGTFRSLRRETVEGRIVYTVIAAISRTGHSADVDVDADADADVDVDVDDADDVDGQAFQADDPSEAYALALLALIRSTR
jgi:hypothetical protein